MERGMRQWNGEGGNGMENESMESGMGTGRGEWVIGTDNTTVERSAGHC